MLPPFIIEQIRQRELKERPARPRLELELELPYRPEVEDERAEEPVQAPRGVIIIDL